MKYLLLRVWNGGELMVEPEFAAVALYPALVSRMRKRADKAKKDRRLDEEFFGSEYMDYGPSYYSELWSDEMQSGEIIPEDDWFVLDGGQYCVVESFEPPESFEPIAFDYSKMIVQYDGEVKWLMRPKHAQHEYETVLIDYDTLAKIHTSEVEL